MIGDRYRADRKEEVVLVSSHIHIYRRERNSRHVSLVTFPSQSNFTALTLKTHTINVIKLIP